MRLPIVVCTVVTLLLSGPVLSAAAAAPVTASAAGEVGVERHAGADRYATSAAIALAAHPSGADAVLLASGTSFPDALSAGALAGARDAPVLLVPVGPLPDVVADALTRLHPQRVTAVGGTARITEESLTAAGAAAGGAATDRVSGRDRYETSARLSGALPSVGVVDGLRTAFLATGERFPDALAAAAPAAGRSLPVLLTAPSMLPGTTATALRSAGIQQVVVVGGPATVSTAVEQQVVGLGLRTTRLAGTDRSATAAAVADWAFSHGVAIPATVALARGDDASQGADALSVAPLAGARHGVLLLTAGPERPSVATSQWASAHAGTVEHLVVAGSETAVSAAAVGFLERRLAPLSRRTPCTAGCSLAVLGRFAGDPASADSPHVLGGAWSVSDATVLDSSAASEGVLLVRRDGTVWAAGHFASFTGAWSDTPRQVPGLSNIVEVVAGGESSMALDASGDVWTWDWVLDPDKRPGALVYQAPTTPRRIPALHGITSISDYRWAWVGGGNTYWEDHALLVRGDGTVWEVRLGQWLTLVAEQVPGLDHVERVVTGPDHAMALRADGMLLAWGWTLNYVFATPLEEVRDPMPRVVLTGVVDIAAGESTDWAVRGDGTVWSWGWSATSRTAGLGEGYLLEPTRVPAIPATQGGDRVQHVSLSNHGIVAVRDDGSGWGWGFGTRSWPADLEPAPFDPRPAGTTVATDVHVEQTGREMFLTR